MHGKMRDTNARGFEFGAWRIRGKKTADVWFESRAIQSFCDFPHLPLAAAGFERPSHQQDWPRH